MSAPELRFEVPPEYAEVYERAYRRAYEEGQGALGSAPEDAPRPVVRGKRAAIPEQRGPADAEGRAARTLRAERGGARARRPGEEESAPVVTPSRRAHRHGRRADRRRGSTALPLVGLAGLMALLLVGAFILGRVTAGTVSPGTPQTGAGPGAAASATQGIAPGQASTSTYDKPTVLARVAAVRAGCTARPGRDAAGAPIAWDAATTVDGDPDTAWRCSGPAVGQVLTFVLARDTPIVQVGIVPGWAHGAPGTAADDFTTYNRVTRVAWLLGDGRTVIQDLGVDPTDRSMRTIVVPRTVTGQVRLRILAIAPGRRNATLISAVELYTPR